MRIEKLKILAKREKLKQSKIGRGLGGAGASKSPSVSPMR